MRLCQGTMAKPSVSQLLFYKNEIPCSRTPFNASRIPAQIIHRRLHATGLMRHARGAQPHLHAAQRAGKLQIAEIAQMANAEDAVIQLAKAIAQAHVEAFQNGGAQRIGAMAFRQAHRRQHG